MAGKEVAVLWLLAVLGSGSGGKVLVWPVDNSHWLNVEYILKELVARGHEVTVLLPSCFLILNATQHSPFHFEVVEVPISKKEMAAIMDESFYFWFYEERELPVWESVYKIVQLLRKLEIVTKTICDGVLRNKMLMERLRASAFDVLVADPLVPSGELFAEMLGSFSDMSKQTCDTLVTNPQLIAKLQQAKFDVLIADPLSVGGELVAQILEIPFVYTFRFSDGNVAERLCGGLPSPPSYVPASTVGMTDQMSFVERLRNFLFYLYTDLFFFKFWQDEWDGYYSKVLGRPTTLCETMGKAEIWLIRTYWDFEFPRPFLPNFEFVGGLHCQPAKPLPKEMEEFVQSSGEHGIVVFSLGSMVYNLTDEKSNVIARALSQLPQKVLWRYKGKKPEALGSNTRTYDWIPQNDLLGHPLTKAFITHGGTNGIYEAIYHGIPLVGIPMFADQHDNIAHMRAKGAAVELDFGTLKTEDLVDAVNAVINNSSYKENALRLSKIHHDQPTKPLDRAVFWIEFVMRHKGAKHLRPAAHHLTWYQYHCLDVLAFLFTCAAIAVFILVKCCLFCCRKRGRIAKRKKE
uniref:glucuronosyltransferase n=1 Tax=Anser brachyrhynchus TaxID=132585 RepID=A0A8B9CBQ6_9AVES